jgi:hypothetical protein
MLATSSHPRSGQLPRSGQGDPPRRGSNQHTWQIQRLDETSVQQKRLATFLACEASGKKKARPADGQAGPESQARAARHDMIWLVLACSHR